MIRRIDRINDFRAFTAWDWPDDELELGRVSVIYGANGSGKSTLSDLLRHVQLSGDLSEVLVSATDDWASNVRVFNREYTQSVLRFDEPTGPRPAALVTLGELSVAAKDRLEAIERELDEIAAVEQAERRDANAAHEAIGKLATDAARELSRVCGAVPRFFRSYNRAHFLPLLGWSRERLAAEGSTDREADVAILQSTRLEPLPLPSWTPVEPAELILRTREVAAVDVVAAQIQEVAQASAELRSWVRDGLRLHGDEDPSCAFCAQPLTQERRLALRSHFSERSEETAALAGQLARDRERIADAIEQLALDLPVLRANLAPELWAEWDAAEAVVWPQMPPAVGALRELQRACAAKAGDAFVMPDVLTATWVHPDFAPFADLARRHNSMVDDLAARKVAAAKRLEVRAALDLADKHDELRGTAAAAERRAADAARLRSDLEGEHARLVKSQRDVAAIARNLTADLAAVLGRDELRFVPVEDATGEQYEVRRGGEPARHLSEGERTTIALLYFLAEVQHGVGAGTLRAPIVVVDDPVSSLDAGVRYGISAQLWHRLVDEPTIGQVIVLTHSFELMRSWQTLIRTNRLDKNSFVGELRMIASEQAAGPARPRVPTLMRVPRKPNGRGSLWATEYHYLFWRVATARAAYDGRDATDVEELEARLLLPNVARRLLEGFLAFRQPGSVGSFEPTVRKLLEGRRGAMPVRMTRWLHEFSHYERVDSSAPTPCGESSLILSAVLEFMRAVDADHVDAMYAALGLEAPTHLGESPAADPPHSLSST